MRRKLLVLNIALVAVIAAAAWRFRVQWQEGHAREQRILQSMPAPAPGPPPSSAQAPPALAAASYSEIAQQMLFAQDRNPNVVLEVAAPKPLPPLPIAHGVVNFGDGPMVILSEKEGGPHRSFSPGDKVGEFMLVAVNTEEVELEFDGQRLKKKLSELRGASAVHPPEPPAAQSVRTEAPPATEQVVIPTKPVPPAGPTGPGRELPGSSNRACQPGDTSPHGTVMNGMRKFLKKTPFGDLCRWEPLQ